jgi:hypothetical protein
MIEGSGSGPLSLWLSDPDLEAHKTIRIRIPNTCLGRWSGSLYPVPVPGTPYPKNYLWSTNPVLKGRVPESRGRVSCWARRRPPAGSCRNVCRCRVASWQPGFAPGPHTARTSRDRWGPAPPYPQLPPDKFINFFNIKLRTCTQCFGSGFTDSRSGSCILG